jgi:homoserine kinase
LIRVFAPATVANVACGFDVFGFAIEGPGDVVIATRSDDPAVRIVDVRGDDGRLPREAHKNTAGVAAARVLAECGATGGVDLVVEKRMPLSSGLGSSAASAVAAAVAVNELLGAELDERTLLACALEGERAACGVAHADNAAPSLLGGFLLVRGMGDEARVHRLPVPAELACALIHPHLAVDTGAARAALGHTIDLSRAVTQWGNVAALVAGLHTNDYDLLATAIRDVVAEPVRSAAVPGFLDVQRAALDSGALGCSLSGSGPSMFALCRGRDVAGRVADAMLSAFLAHNDVACDALVSRVGTAGARVEAS